MVDLEDKYRQVDFLPPGLTFIFNRRLQNLIKGKRRMKGANETSMTAIDIIQDPSLEDIKENSEELAKK